jgi:aminobenzoyl-glutamate utilization protein B
MTIGRIAAFAAGAAMLCWSGVSAQTAPDVATLKKEAFADIDARADRLGRLGDAIFSYSEIGFQEYKTVALVSKELSSHGFTVKTGVADMPTAYMATYGSGSPMIGLMSEYDGVPGASQKPTAMAHDAISPGAPGHGEGHNTHQPTLIGAALAMKAIKDKYKLPGTIVVYGGPAEELLASRGYMVKAGLFKGLDAILQVHVGTAFGTSYGFNNFGNVSVLYSFKGAQAHGATPWQGRSALDGVELFDAGIQFMREHGYDPQNTRIQSVIPNGGKQPNVVPGEASDWYYIRAATPELVESSLAWMRQIAKAAATMSHTEVTERILSASWPFNGNKALAQVVDKNVQLVGMPQWSADDITFAKYKQKSMGVKESGLTTAVSPLSADSQGSSTSDAGDMTWQVPNNRMYIPTNIEGSLAGHHWSSAIGPATPIAHKGMVVGAKALVGSMIDLFTDPALRASIHKDFQAQLAAYKPWHSLIPDGAKPPTFLNVEEMAKYRAALKPYEYDPDSKQTYFQFLKVAYPGVEPKAGVGKLSNAPQTDFGNSSIDWDWEK